MSNRIGYILKRAQHSTNNELHFTFVVYMGRGPSCELSVYPSNGGTVVTVCAFNDNSLCSTADAAVDVDLYSLVNIVLKSCFFTHTFLSLCQQFPSNYQ
jgi:hypothetical protein